MKKRILTWDRPTWPLHIGHYFWSLKNRVALQDDYDSFIIIADIQGLTDNFNNPEKVRKNVYELTKDYLAVWIDPNKATIFIQSLIPEIAELTIFYSNLVTISRLQQNPTVKEEIKQKRELFKESVTFGFLGYPVSQAADITAFQADLVPVWEDQLPMIEQTREIVRKFNNIYGPTLKEPSAKISEFPRVKWLDGNDKMWKSLNNAIFLWDSPEIIEKKVKGAFTDPKKIKIDDKWHPNGCAVFYYHSIFNVNDLKIIEDECKKWARWCGQCKMQLSKSIIDFLAPIREKRKYYDERPKLVEEILIEWTKKAREVAKETLALVKEKMFLNYFL